MRGSVWILNVRHVCFRNCLGSKHTKCLQSKHMCVYFTNNMKVDVLNVWSLGALMCLLFVFVCSLCVCFGVWVFGGPMPLLCEWRIGRLAVFERCCGGPERLDLQCG